MVVPTWALKLEYSRLSASIVNVKLRRGNFNHTVSGLHFLRAVIVNKMEPRASCLLGRHLTSGSSTVAPK